MSLSDLARVESADVSSERKSSFTVNNFEKEDLRKTIRAKAAQLLPPRASSK